MTSMSTSRPAPTCPVPLEYKNLLVDRGFRRETEEVRIPWYRRIFNYQLPAPVVWRSSSFDLKFVWDRTVEAYVGPPGAEGWEQWISLELLLPLVAGKPIYEVNRSILPHSYYAAGLVEHFDAIALAVSPDHFAQSYQTIKVAGEENFRSRFGRA